jgi:Leucine-rich repeat (LRR) protein
MLDSLAVDNILLTDRELRAISEKTSLTSLEISGLRSQYTDEGVSHLRRLSGLKHLELSFNQFLGERALPHITKLRNLESLTLVNDNQIPASSYTVLTNLPVLRKLHIGSNNALKDADLKHLEKLTRLETLDLTYCDRLSGQGVEKLRKALPKTKVIWTKRPTFS